MTLTDWTSDADVFSTVDKNVGLGYSWGPGPNISGETLHYKALLAALIRNESTRKTVGSWN